MFLKYYLSHQVIAKHTGITKHTAKHTGITKHTEKHTGITKHTAKTYGNYSSPND